MQDHEGGIEEKVCRLSSGDSPQQRSRLRVSVKLVSLNLSFSLGPQNHPLEQANTACG